MERDWTCDDSGEEDELSQLGEVGEGGRERPGEAGRVGEASAESEGGDSARGAGDAGEGGAGIWCGGVPGGEECCGTSEGDIGEGVLDGDEGVEIDGADFLVLLLMRRWSEIEKEEEKKKWKCE